MKTAVPAVAAAETVRRRGFLQTGQSGVWSCTMRRHKLLIGGGRCSRRFDGAD